jgi:hypothetical protein
VGILGSADDPALRRRRVPRSRVLRAAGAVVAAVAAVALSGCASNFSAATNQPYQPAAGIANRDGDVYSINTLVVTDGSGNGTVVASLINQQADDDTLQSFTAVDSSGKQITALPLDSPIALPAYPSPNQAVAVGSSGDLRLSGDNLEAGTFVSLTFVFANAAPMTVNVPVVLGGADTNYADIPVGPVPTSAASG